MKLEKWDTVTAEKERRICQRLLNKHECNGERTNLARENCGACVLNGFHNNENPERALSPNYAGWARIYVCAGKAIPEKYRQAFIQELDENNSLYTKALRRDIITFGLNIQ